MALYSNTPGSLSYGQEGQAEDHSGDSEDPSGSNYPTTPFDPPSPLSKSHPIFRSTPSSIPIPGATMSGSTPIAGPSSEGAAIGRRDSAEAPPLPFSPSSAPAVPTVVAVAHPSLYIHTQHPRRGSMTPLGLHVISPVPPNPNNPTPIRNVGFSPSYQPTVDLNDDLRSARRGSTASTCSTLTQSRPQQSHPSGFNRERRRSSITPTLPTLAAPAPTRAHVPGRHSRPTSSDGSEQHTLHGRTRTGDNAPKQPLTGSPLAPDYGRRGSMPHLGTLAGQTYARPWNPSLPPPRSSLAEEGQLPDEGYRFGSGAPSPPEIHGSSAAAALLRNLDISRSRRPSSTSRKAKDVFEETEQEEAERQRKAFLDATYGHDGKRARERLSFAAPSGSSHLASPGQQNMRRQSLALWEKISMTQGLRNTDSPATAMTDPVSLPSLSAAKSLEELAPRRGSLPVAIPGSGLGRSPSNRRESIRPQISVGSDGEIRVEDLEEASEEDISYNNNGLSVPQRPLPPLLPLSDPGPRLLPSTLALHRANHLLNSRNLQAEPLPHPLPPSLHPPAPVDLAEFDIDFILAGSQAQLGGDQAIANSPVDVLHPTSNTTIVAAPTLRLGQEEEDSFAKFVGEFDDEYGGRRGEWTFRACQSQWVASPGAVAPRTEWDCAGAGRYELYGNGDVRSVQTGSVWRIRKSGPREYEVEEKVAGKPYQIDSPQTVIKAVGSSGDCFVLASKSSHSDFGGIKLATKHRANALESQLRFDISDQLGPGRTDRIASTDSTATARGPTGISSSLPAFGTVTPRKSQAEFPDPLVPPPSLGERYEAQGRVSVSGPSARSKEKERAQRSDSRDAAGDAEEKKKGGRFGTALKRAFKNTLAAADERKAAREEKERERMQSQSWSPSASRSRDYIHPSGKEFAEKSSRNHIKTAPAALIERKARGSTDTSETPRPPPVSWFSTASSPARPRSPSSFVGEQNPPVLREGKAWNGVPEEAIAMVVPIEEDVNTITPLAPGQTRRGGESSRQALLVWFVPFNSESDDRPATAASSVSSRQGTENVPHSTSKSPVENIAGSLPKFQKLLRRRASKDKDALKREREGLTERMNNPAPSSIGNPPSGGDNRLSCALHAMPFRSFRVVARVVEIEDLRSEPAAASSSYSNSRTSSNYPASASLSSGQSPYQFSGSLPSTDEQEVISPVSTAPTSNILAGRVFPTVIAVCHSRSQGVEFVLEGLDRLGFCQGESAWGPTGYEEWRGSGLSEKGRDFLDLLWAGCVGVMGLTGI